MKNVWLERRRQKSISFHLTFYASHYWGIKIFAAEVQIIPAPDMPGCFHVRSKEHEFCVFVRSIRMLGKNGIDGRIAVSHLGFVVGMFDLPGIDLMASADNGTDCELIFGFKDPHLIKTGYFNLFV